MKIILENCKIVDCDTIVSLSDKSNVEVTLTPPPAGVPDAAAWETRCATERRFSVNQCSAEERARHWREQGRSGVEVKALVYAAPTRPASERQQAVVMPKITGTALVEVVNGAEGPSLYIGNEDGGYRLAGPPPWGGGRTIHKFTVKLDELVREAMDLAGVNQGVTTEAGNGGEV